MLGFVSATSTSRRWIALWVCLAASLISSPGVVAQTEPEPQVPAAPQDPGLAKVYALFDRLCARCHQTGKLETLRAARGLGNILDLNALAADPVHVRPGNPDGSPLYTILQSRLPPHDFPNADLSGEDLDAVREWLQSTPPVAKRCLDRTPIDPSAITAAMAKVLEEAGTEAAKSIRFLSLAEAYNACTASDPEMKVFGEALGHMVNGLSWGLDPVKIESVGENLALFKIDLGRIGWTPARWERLVGAYPYAATTPRTPTIEEATSSRMPLVRGDWFVAMAGRAPLYYDLLGLSDRVQALHMSLRVDLNSAIAQSKVRRIGLKTSSVSRGQRLLQRLPFANGALWTTYEYAPTPGRPDLFDAPGGPGSRGASRPDASLTMFSLPSGFNAFFIANGDGNRIADLPTSVMRDDGHPTGRVTVGAGCLACHSAGIQPATDELRSRIQGDTSIPRDIRERASALHVTADEMKRLIEEDNARIAKALTSAGLTPALTINGMDPVGALTNAYEQPLTAPQVAAELGIDLQRLSAALAESKPAAGVSEVLQRLNNGTISRREFETRVGELHRAIVTPSGPPPATFEQTREQVEPFELILRTAKNTFQAGEILTITARASEACYLTLVNIDRNGRGTVIFPNDFEGNNRLEAGKDLRVPAEGSPYQFRLRDKGRETIVGICLAGQKTPAGFRHDFERQRFTELGDYRAFVRRTAHLELDERKSVTKQPAARPIPQRGRRSRVDQPEPQTRTTEPQARTAIQITIE